MRSRKRQQSFYADTQLLRSVCNLFVTAEQQCTSSQLQMVSGTQYPQLNRMSIDTTAVRAVQIRENHLPMIVLQFGMQTTDTFVVQLHSVHFPPPDGDRSVKVTKNAAAFKALVDQAQSASKAA